VLPAGRTLRLPQQGSPEGFIGKQEDIPCVLPRMLCRLPAERGGLTMTTQFLLNFVCGLILGYVGMTIIIIIIFNLFDI
jgi:hypothetical protein